MRYPTAELPHVLKEPNLELVAAFPDAPKNPSAQAQTYTKRLHIASYTPKISSWDVSLAAAS